MITMIVAMFGLDIYINEYMNTDIFENNRKASQNALIEEMEQINQYEKIDQAKILENWLANWINSINLPFNEIKLQFALVNTEPQVIMVKVKGYDYYAMIDDVALVDYICNTLVVERE